MKIYDIDYYANSGTSFLHKMNFKIKCGITLLLFILILMNFNINFAIFYFLLILAILTVSKVEKLKILKLSLFSLVFLFLFFFSINSLSIDYFVLILLKVVSISTLFVTLIFTTPYFKIFAFLQKFLPTFVVNVLFFTYRGIFIMFNIFENIRTVFLLRGGIDYKKPINTFKTIANSIGFIIIKSIDTSEHLYEMLNIRGYEGKFHYVGR